MKYTISFMLSVVGIIHLLPLSGLLGANRLASLYGVVLDDLNLVILMRHRAVLFGLLGVFLIVAAFRSEFQVAAFVAGFVSVVSFLILAGTAGEYNASIRSVLIADLVALFCLVVGSVCYSIGKR
jgi:hypothetical protein